MSLILGDWQDAVPAGASFAVLNTQDDAIDQITQLVSQSGGIASLHIISHGASGQLKLAGQTIDQQTLIERGQRNWFLESIVNQKAQTFLFTDAMSLRAKKVLPSSLS